jgi:nitrite reductase (NADH) large subunit
MRKVSGFTLLGGGVILSIITFRKRIKSFSWLSFSFWRVFHVVLGALLLVALLVHSGARMGDNLNYWLMLSFIGVVISGGLLGVGISNDHQLPAKAVRAVREWSLWLHLLFLWPLPVLLSFHILKAFYFK